MKIYWIQYDVERFQELAQDADPLETNRLARIQKTRKFYRCQPIVEPLIPPDVYSPQPRLRRGDFWGFAPYSTFAVSPASVDKVRPFLEEAGELLPLPYKSEIFSVLNVLKCADCVDPATEELGILRRKYLIDRVPCGIFREPNGVYLFVSEMTGDPATEFKAYVEHEGMTGLIFREVWESLLPHQGQD